MKMNRQNPGGEGGLDKSMRGNEKYQTGKGTVFQSDYGSSNPLKKGTRQSESKLGDVTMRGNERPNGHAKTSFQGAVVTGTSKACK